MKNAHLLFFIALGLFGCVEEFKLETQSFTEAFVVESTLTNELKHQKVKLSYVFKLEQEDPTFVNNAQVWIEDENNSTYTFSETDLGVYTSDEAFKAIKDNEYKLFINTSDGKKFESRGEYLTPNVPINKLYGKTETLNEVYGVQVYVDSYEDVGLAKYFRYEYNETYKIVTPYTITKNLELTNVIPGELEMYYDISIIPAVVSNPVCYSSSAQTKIIQLNITGASENNIHKFPIRFISQNDFRIRDRYSIFVKQYTQTYDSYNFYKTLNELGTIESLLEANQPGFVTGNLYSKTNTSEKVVGFFDVSSVSSKRIFFDYSTFNVKRPNYAYTCKTDTLDYNDNTFLDEDRNDRIYLYEVIANRTPPWNFLTALDEQKYVIISPECSDCTTFSSTLKPEFWED